MKNQLFKLALAAGFIGVVYLGGTAGCDDHDHDDGDHSHTDAGGHTSPFPDCQAIIDKCHPLDVGEETAIHTCHDLAHDAKDNATCAAKKNECVLGICVVEAGSSGGDAGDGG